MNRNAGWRSSEFWMSLATTALGVLTTLGVLSAGGPIAVIVGGVLTVAPTLLYTQQRTALKVAAVAGLTAVATNPNGSLVDAEDPALMPPMRPTTPKER